MRDKVELNATLYLPKTPDGFTAEDTGDLHAYALHLRHLSRARRLLRLPWLCLCAGRCARPRQFRRRLRTVRNEPNDGHDVVEWLAKQPFCDGKVAMWGGSYAGFDQWATAKEFPPHLTTIVPVAAAHPGLDYPSYNNIGDNL